MKYLIVTGTRADFGKLKGLIKKLDSNHDDEVVIVATGMHLLKEFGETVIEIEKIFPGKIKNIEGQRFQENMSVGFSRFIKNFDYLIESEEPDLVIVHGDRFDALGASIVASNRSIHVLHIEGGEVSGTIDEAIRHSVTKFSHLHMVSNETSQKRVIQLGENPEHTFITGSPETDVLTSSELPDLEYVKNRYNITYPEYSIFCFHPVTSEYQQISSQIKVLTTFARLINENIIWIYPNNDAGGSVIIEELQEIDDAKIKIFDSIRFENYITLLKNSKMIVGNSSSGVREAPVLGVPCLNVGSRQQGRVQSDLVYECEIDLDCLVKTYELIEKTKSTNSDLQFGDGDVANKIMDILKSIDLNSIPIQKKFYE